MLGQRKTLVVTGHAVAPKGTVLHERNKLMTVALELDWESGEILDADTTFITRLCKDYLKNLLQGKKILLDQDNIRNQIETTFHVDSQKALLKALGVATERYRSLRAKT
ncbi:MAG: DUF3870 domain-containing protein [Desulfitobacterium hafniense]|nr:DUF3870 domain-containing protein [Desulfitobacterium hafniense]